MPDLIALTGVTGALGGRVANLLADTANPLRFITRDPARSPPIDAEVRQGSYDDAEAMTAALKDVDVLLLVSAREDKDRLDHHRSALEAAAAAGVGKIVYTSFIGAAPDSTFTLGRQHAATEDFIQRTGIPFVFLRDNLYADFVPYFAGSNGVIRGPAGDGRVGFVTRDDIAESAAVVLTTTEHDGTTFDMTGPSPSISTKRPIDSAVSSTGRSATALRRSTRPTPRVPSTTPLTGRWRVRSRHIWR